MRTFAQALSRRAFSRWWGGRAERRAPALPAHPAGELTPIRRVFVPGRSPALRFVPVVGTYPPAVARRAQRSLAGVLRELACNSSGPGRITSSFVAE